MVSEPSLEVELIRDVMIPMRDGIKLAANLYRPRKVGKYPGIFSFYPYLKDGWIGIDHDPHHRYFASCGYAVMQVDFRGTGSSHGENPHPFDLQERRDGFDIVEWMAEQSWCTGAVGVWGISYGGITSLSIASESPPHLKAIIPINGTFDNYEWLLRTHGGRGLLLADVDWGTRMAAINMLPPVLQDPGGEWFSKWQERLTPASPWFMDWHGSPPTPDFWTSRIIPLKKIEVPTFAISGWHDAYTAPAFRVFEQVSGPARVLIGPWKHVLPDISPHHPIGGLHEMVRWWDRWLKEIGNGIDAEPPVAIFVEGADEWRYETEWPIERTVTQRYHLSPARRLENRPAGTETLSYRYDSRVGIAATGNNGHRLHLEIPDDQVADDFNSLAFTGAPLDRDIEITGEPVASIVISADVAELTLVAKLCLVDPDGRSRMISRGNANPSRKDAHAVAELDNDVSRRRVDIRMHPTSVVARKGQSLRLSLAGADFPELWPTPLPYVLQVHCAECTIDVPFVPQNEHGSGKPDFKPARTDVDTPQPMTPDGNEQFDVVHYRLGSRSVAFETRLVTKHCIEGNVVLKGSHWAKVITDSDSPGSTNLRTKTDYELQGAACSVKVTVDSLLTHKTVSCRANIDLDGHRFREMNWTKKGG
jgi:uncharacterized protein